MDGAQVTDDTRLRGDAADGARTQRPRRDRAAAVAFRPAQGRDAARHVDRAAGAAAAPAGRPLGPLHRGLPGARGRARDRDACCRAISACSKTRASTSARRTTTPSSRKAHGRARRFLCRRCLLDGAPRACLDRGHHPFPAELCRPGDGGRTERARKRAGQSRAAGRGGGRRRQGFDQARRARPPGRQGRSSDHRRRHGQHLPRRARRRCRQVAVRA